MTIYLNILKKNDMGSTSTYNMFSVQKGFIVSSKVMHSILGLRKKASYQTEKKITKSLYIGKQSGIQFTIFIKVLRLSAMEYMCHKWPRIYSTCRKHFPVFSSFMTYHQVCDYINSTGATSGTGTVLPFRSTYVHLRFLVRFVLFDL